MMAEWGWVRWRKIGFELGRRFGLGWLGSSLRKFFWAFEAVVKGL